MEGISILGLDPEWPVMTWDAVHTYLQTLLCVHTLNKHNTQTDRHNQRQTQSETATDKHGHRQTQTQPQADTDKHSHSQTHPHYDCITHTLSKHKNQHTICWPTNICNVFDVDYNSIPEIWSENHFISRTFRHGVAKTHHRVVKRARPAVVDIMGILFFFFCNKHL